VHTQIAGININYERIGAGKPVLILHGWGANIDAVRPIANHLAAIGREAVALDLPGFGKSGVPETPWKVADYANLVRAFIGFCEIALCDVICHSFGGRIAIMLASEDPSLFSRLVLVDSAGIRPKRGAKYYVRVYSYKLAKRMMRVKFLSRLFRLDERVKHAGSADYRSLSGVMRATLSLVVNEDLTARLERIGNETLLIWGENDAETPLAMAKVMEKKIKNAGLAVIPGAGHFSYLDDYPRFCSIIDVLFKEDPIA